VTYLRRIVRDIADGFYAGWNLLFYGWPYPRHLPTRPDPEETL
jgi:hypothetical protein